MDNECSAARCLFCHSACQFAILRQHATAPLSAKRASQYALFGQHGAVAVRDEPCAELRAAKEQTRCSGRYRQTAHITFSSAMRSITIPLRSAPMHILVNDFAIRSFRETADKDYITARMARRARLIQPFLWSALHCLEKYVKGILVLNRIDAKELGHTVLPGIERMKQRGKFEIELSADTVKFIKGLEDYEAKYRYWEAGNSPFFLHPEIIDEVVKYVYIPKDITEGVRQFAKQKAAEKAKAEQDAKKAAKPAAKQSGKTG